MGGHCQPHTRIPGCASGATAPACADTATMAGEGTEAAKTTYRRRDVCRADVANVFDAALPASGGCLLADDAHVERRESGGEIRLSDRGNPRGSGGLHARYNSEETPLKMASFKI